MDQTLEITNKPRNSLQLSVKLLQLLKGCPKAGNGVHRWLFRTALALHPYVADKELLVHILTKATLSCGREVSIREIEDAVRNSQRNQNHGGPRTPRWPRPDERRIAEIAKQGPSLERLTDLSPVKLGGDGARADEVLDLLFPGNPLLCVGESQFRFDTRPRESWRGRLARCQFIVPSPMTSVYGTTKAGKRSKHTLENTGPRRFLVIEFDQGGFDQHAAILHHLASYGDFVMAVHSGGKSIHGWFYCLGVEEARLLKFMRYAVGLGADPATWTKSQFVRLPDGQRENGKRQSVIYLDKNLLEAK